MKIQQNTKILVYFFIFLFLHFFITPIYAADFRTSYSIEYYVQEDVQGLTKTAYTIEITNLQPDLIIKKFTLSFPKSFGVEQITARDSHGVISAVTTLKERTIEATFELNNPTAGLNEKNVLYLDFMQRNIFRSKGSVWEVFIPTLEMREGDYHSVSVFLPPGKHKKLSLSKPMPSSVSLDTVVWNGDTGKSIYAVFGNEQRYEMSLSYHLVNPNVYNVYTDVAFPPDTAYQKIVVDSIIPPPDMVYSDSDGNYMARYNLTGHANKQIQFKGIASVYATPRSDFRKIAQKQFESQQQKTLFDMQPLWKLDSETPIKSSIIKEHYDYTLKTLTYNFQRIIKGNSRMGAGEALRYPDQAVCTEYSDVLIASARERGIYIREVQGFAFASEQELRPIQTESDILHSWVEYYDTQKNVWVPIDPTWEDTSGIDYFSSFDFNHIVFALHGKKADYPYPAGSYKQAPGGQDIRINPTTSLIAEIKKLKAEIAQIPIPASDDTFTVDATVTNEGNVSLWEIPLRITGTNATIERKDIIIEHLLPREQKKLEIVFQPKSALLYQNVSFHISYDGNEIGSQRVQVPTIITSVKKNMIPAMFILGGIVLLLFIFKKKRDDYSRTD